MNVSGVRGVEGCSSLDSESDSFEYSESVIPLMTSGLGMIYSVEIHSCLETLLTWTRSLANGFRVAILNFPLSG